MARTAYILAEKDLGEVLTGLARGLEDRGLEHGFAIRQSIGPVSALRQEAPQATDLVVLVGDGSEDRRASPSPKAFEAVYGGRNGCATVYVHGSTRDIQGYAPNILSLAAIAQQHAAFAYLPPRDASIEKILVSDERIQTGRRLAERRTLNRYRGVPLQYVPLALPTVAQKIRGIDISEREQAKAFGATLLYALLNTEYEKKEKFERLLEILAETLEIPSETRYTADSPLKDVVEGMRKEAEALGQKAWGHLLTPLWLKKFQRKGRVA
ncbi:hypothetical protein HYS48_04750 [Candidatus Woesearchaeota archaeon]|nr:hypothetical protein [Candidatus Woesearchaeota archaeon]